MIKELNRTYLGKLVGETTVISIIGPFERVPVTIEKIDTTSYYQNKAKFILEYK